MVCVLELGTHHHTVTLYHGLTKRSSSLESHTIGIRYEKGGEKSRGEHVGSDFTLKYM